MHLLPRQSECASGWRSPTEVGAVLIRVYVMYGVQQGLTATRWELSGMQYWINMRIEDDPTRVTCAKH